MKISKMGWLDSRKSKAIFRVEFRYPHRQTGGFELVKMGTYFFRPFCGNFLKLGFLGKLGLIGFVLPEGEGAVCFHNPLLILYLCSFGLFLNWL